MVRVLLAFSIAVAVACCDSSTQRIAPTWTEIPESQDPATQERLGEAGAAALQLGQGLLKKLQQQIGESGPVGAIGFCHQNAIPLTDTVNASLADRFDGRVRIGRTSHRLRNPDNTPPAWAAEAVARAENRRHVFEGPDGKMGFLLPITTGPLCLNCHGPGESLAPDLRDALATRYPQDQATGFAAGDLRGYFWVESN